MSGFLRSSFPSSASLMTAAAVTTFAGGADPVHEGLSRSLDSRPPSPPVPSLSPGRPPGRNPSFRKILPQPPELRLHSTIFSSSSSFLRQQSIYRDAPDFSRQHHGNRKCEYHQSERAIRRISHGSTTKFISEIPSCSNKRSGHAVHRQAAAAEPANVPPTDAGRKTYGDLFHQLSVRIAQSLVDTEFSSPPCQHRLDHHIEHQHHKKHGSP